MTQSTEDLRQHLADFLLSLAQKDQKIEGWDAFPLELQNQIVDVVKALHSTLSAPLDTAKHEEDARKLANWVILPEDGEGGSAPFEHAPLNDLGISFSPRTCSVCHKRIEIGRSNPNPGGCISCGQ